MDTNPKESTNPLPFKWEFSFKDYPIDPGLTDDDGNVLPRPFTKSQMRKWLKRIKWENRKAEKRHREKIKAKMKRKEAKQGLIELGPSRKVLKKMKLTQEVSKVGVIIDLSFDNLMIEKDRFKLIKQILRSYSINRRSLKPVQLSITNFNGRVKNEISRHNGYEHWDIKFIEQSYLDVFDKEKLVYLTSESDNIIEEFEPNCYYIIGGLVDHNEHKGISYNKACEQGIRHGKLPLDRYVNMLTRKVLTVDHVFEIILRKTEGLSWQEIFKKVLPERKGAVVLEEINKESTEENKPPSNGVENIDFNKQ